MQQIERVKRHNTPINFAIKSCGKAHPACGICRPGFNKDSAETKRRNGTFAGARNPMWRGGVMKRSFIGWKAIRRQVWERDKVCKVCQKPPYEHRRFDVHHIIAVRDGGTNDLDNLVGLHHDCHMQVECGNIKL